MKVLVTGGAGYIGSVTAAYLLDRNYEVSIFDNLSTGNTKLIDQRANFIYGDILDQNAIESAVQNCDAVIHLAGKALVEESVSKPHEYEEVNFRGTLNVLNGMKKNGVKKLIFSSTCAVYGEAKKDSIDELQPLDPKNPYASSKLKSDKLIREFSTLNGMNAIVLRFFNVAGSYINNNNCMFGELHQTETHLIPNVIKSESINVYGDDWPTKDGTCVRDYVHVIDLAIAIEKSLNYKAINNFDLFNLGSGKGSSVSEVVETVEKVLNKKIEKNICERRKGDVSILVGNSEHALINLKWKTTQNLYTIIKDSVAFHNLNFQKKLHE
jgi:UDP-glucose 4-epimerase